MDRETADTLNLVVRRVNEHTQLLDYSARAMSALSTSIENLAKASRMTSDTVSEQQVVIKKQEERIKQVEKTQTRLLVCVGGLVLYLLLTH